MSDSWDKRFLELAAGVAAWSKDPRCKVGAVIVRPDRTIVSLGYNGFARGVRDTRDRLDNREQKLFYTVHAELNAILTAREPLAGTTLYVVPLHPCASCAGAIIQAGIKRVVTPPSENPGRWALSFEAAGNMLAEAGVEVSCVEVTR